VLAIPTSFYSDFSKIKPCKNYKYFNKLVYFETLDGERTRKFDHPCFVAFEDVGRCLKLDK
jgi:hypothetical protein